MPVQTFEAAAMGTQPQPVRSVDTVAIDPPPALTQDRDVATQAIAPHQSEPSLPVNEPAALKPVVQPAPALPLEATTQPEPVIPPKPATEAALAKKASPSVPFRTIFFLGPPPCASLRRFYRDVEFPIESLMRSSSQPGDHEQQTRSQPGKPAAKKGKKPNKRDKRLRGS